MTTVRIYVTYKQSVFDPQAESVLNAIHQLGHEEVKDLTVGKICKLKAIRQPLKTRLRKWLNRCWLTSTSKRTSLKCWRRNK